MELHISMEGRAQNRVGPHFKKLMVSEIIWTVLPNELLNHDVETQALINYG